MQMLQLRVPFMFTSGSEFAGNRFDMARNIRISYKIDGKGEELGLIVHNTKGDMLADKIE
ncbi:MAG: hypothetical protein WA915_07770 [Candidatus Aminicenantaceae bacterium]